MVTFEVKDMTCGHCASTITKALAAVDKSARIEVDIAGKLVRVSGGTPAGLLAEAIQEAGYTPHEVQAAPAQEPVARRAAGGCGCGCGPRKLAAVDVAQAPASTAASCCG